MRYLLCNHQLDSSHYIRFYWISREKILHKRSLCASTFQQAQSTPNTPNLHAHNLKLFPLLTQTLIPKRQTATTNPPLQHAIQPKPIPPIPTAHTQKPLLTKDQIIIDPTIRKRLEPYPFRRRSTTSCRGRLSPVGSGRGGKMLSAFCLEGGRRCGGDDGGAAA